MSRGLVVIIVILFIGGLICVYAQPVDGARCLIFTPDSFVDVVRPLADWRTTTGNYALIIPLSQVEATPQQVRNFIRDAYSNWPLKPEFVLLFCNPGQLRAYNDDNDCYYGDMGGDYRMEIPVGRMPARNRREAEVMVAKVLAYERLLGFQDTGWLVKGTTTVQDYASAPDSWYLPDCYFVHSRWQGHNYLHIDTFYSLWGHNSHDLIRVLNEGRAFITYRGYATGNWYEPFGEFYPNSNWRNGYRLPVIVAGTCQTVTLAPGEEMLGDKSVRFGSAESLGGAVAYFGTTRSANRVSHYRSSCFRGFFWGLFKDSLEFLGWATIRGRQWVDSLYPSQTRYTEWNLIGDPAMRVWTGMPRNIIVSHPFAVNCLPQDFEVQVRTGGEPVKNAQVCVWLDSVVYASGYTDSTGRAVFAINPVHPGEMRVTVTGNNLIPYEGVCQAVVTGMPFVVYRRHQVIDSFPWGNGDGLIGAGETVGVRLWIENLGDSGGSQLSLRLRADDSLLTLFDSIGAVSYLAPHDSVYAGIFRLYLGQRCPDGYRFVIRIGVTDETGRYWESRFGDFGVRAKLVLDSIKVIDSLGNRNGRLDPNEMAEFIFTLRNTGSGGAMQTRGILMSTDSRLEVRDSVGFWGDIPGFNRSRNTSDRFTVYAQMMVPSIPIVCTLTVNAVYYAEKISFVISPGVLCQTDPASDGPRMPPLYWAYDNIDTNYPDHPEYNWVEIKETGVNLNLRDNQTVQLTLPDWFGSFRFYGTRYEQISVCSNGWVAPGITDFIGWYNYPLPRGLEPPMLAVYWDDLVPDANNNVYYLFDSLNHRLVIEWDSVWNRESQNGRAKFQIIIYDSTQSAVDGNSIFEFQYKMVSSGYNYTVGIQDPSDTIGINLVYNQNRHRACAPVVSGRCIRFTTNQPFVAFRELTNIKSVLRGKKRTTVVKQAIMVPGADSKQRGGFLFDTAGRKVKELYPGKNDVEGLKPGVYFIYIEDGKMVDKVIIVR